MSGALVVFLQAHGAQKELSEALSRIGFASEGFTDPRIFLRRLKEGSPLAGIVDLCGEDAPIMLAMIKSIRSVLGVNLPLFALVPAKDPGLGAKARTAGATDILSRPLDDDDLLGAIAGHAPIRASETIEMPKLVKWFFETVSPALAGLGSVLDTSSELELQIKYYETRLQPYHDYFINMISAMRKTDAKADLAQCIRMYGMRNTRALLVAMKLSELTGQPLVGFSAKTGALVGDPNSVLKFANQTLDHFGEGSRNQFEAFNAGLVLDLLTVLAESSGTRKSAVRNYIGERYVEAIQQADKCIAVGKKAQSLMLERQIIGTILMREAGKAAMAIFFPDYLEVRRKLEKKELKPVLQHIAELRRFSVSHNLMGALLCQGAPGLGEAYRAILFFEYPYMTTGLPGGTEVYNLVRVCNQNGFGLTQ